MITLNGIYRALQYVDGLWHIYVCNWIEKLYDKGARL